MLIKNLYLCRLFEDRLTANISNNVLLELAKLTLCTVYIVANIVLQKSKNFLWSFNVPTVYTVYLVFIFNLSNV